MDLGRLNPDRVEEVFARHGACSIAFSDAGGEPLLEPAPGATPLWPDSRISGLFPADTDLAKLTEDLVRTLRLEGLPAHETGVLADRAWEREWLRDLGPMRFGEHLWVCPGGDVAVPRDAVVVRMDPGLAFGTGTHATTALCLEWLDGLDLDGATVLDFGCGSGILAIAALKLGAASAVAVDIDPQAIRATAANAAHNAVAGHLTTESGTDAASGPYDVVVANILAGPLIELADAIAGSVGGGCLLGLSGILSGQVEDVLAAYAPWIAFDDPLIREQGGQAWARLTGRRIEG